VWLVLPSLLERWRVVPCREVVDLFARLPCYNGVLEEVLLMEDIF
jgi:hypothetical protein